MEWYQMAVAAFIFVCGMGVGAFLHAMYVRNHG